MVRRLRRVRFRALERSMMADLQPRLYLLPDDDRKRLAAFRDKWGVDGPEMECRALGLLEARAGR